MFFYRTATMPSVQKILELERIIVVDGAGNNVPGRPRRPMPAWSENSYRAVLPQVIHNPGDINTLYMNDPNKFTLISQGSFDRARRRPERRRHRFDGNGWAELKARRSRVWLSSVSTPTWWWATPVPTKAFVSFTVTVNAADITSGVTNKDINIPAGTRFGNAALGSASATSWLSRRRSSFRPARRAAARWRWRSRSHKIRRRAF